MLDFIKARLTGVLAILLALAVLGGLLQTVRLERSERTFSEFREAQANAAKRAERERADEIEKARVKEQEIIGAAEIQKGKDDEKLQALAVERDSLAVQLRNRPRRPAATQAGAVAATPTPAGCSCTAATGAELSREDAEFLVGEAATSQLRGIALQSCQQQYDDARERLKQ